MAKYVVVHTPRIEDASQDMLFELLRGVTERVVPETEWLNSWLAVDSSRMFCLWEAPSEDAIRAVLGEETLELSPIQTIYEVVDVNPDYFTEG